MADQDENIPLVKTFFVITGPGLVPSDVTLAIGLTPTETRHDTKFVGVPEDGEPLYRYPEWILEHGRTASVDTDEEVQKLLAVVWPRRKEILEFLESSSYKAGFGTTIRHFGWQPLISLTHDSLEKLAQLKIRYTIDIFDHSDNIADPNSPPSSSTPVPNS